MAEEKQMCFGCGQRPATSTDGTVPLCAQCAAQAAKNKRGVKYETEEEPPPDTLRSV